MKILIEKAKVERALEALKVARDQIVDPTYAPIGWSVSRLDETLGILQEALAEQLEHPCIACGAEIGHAENCARVRWGIAKPAQHLADDIEWEEDALADQPAQQEQEPTIAACITGADSVGNKIDGYEAAKVYAAMQKAMRFETSAPQPSQYGSPEMQTLIVARATSEQPSRQEPVAIVAVDGVGQIQVGWRTKPQHNDKLYTSPPAQQEPGLLGRNQCDKLVERVMSKLASKHNPAMSSQDLNPNIMTHHALRHSIVQAAFMAGTISTAHGIKENT